MRCFNYYNTVSVNTTKLVLAFRLDKTNTAFSNTYGRTLQEQSHITHL